MFFVALLILRKLLIELIVRYYLQSSLIVIKHSCVMLLLVLAYWYSHQQVFIRWQSNYSQSFHIGRGVRQGDLMSPYLFKLYVRDMLKRVVDSEIGCNIASWLFSEYIMHMLMIWFSWPLLGVV